MEGILIAFFVLPLILWLYMVIERNTNWTIYHHIIIFSNNMFNCINNMYRQIPQTVGLSSSRQILDKM